MSDLRGGIEAYREHLVERNEFARHAERFDRLKRAGPIGRARTAWRSPAVQRTVGPHVLRAARRSWADEAVPAPPHSRSASRLRPPCWSGAAAAPPPRAARARRSRSTSRSSSRGSSRAAAGTRRSPTWSAAWRRGDTTFRSGSRTGAARASSPSWFGPRRPADGGLRRLGGGGRRRRHGLADGPPRAAPARRRRQGLPRAGPRARVLRHVGGADVGGADLFARAALRVRVALAGGPGSLPVRRERVLVRPRRAPRRVPPPRRRAPGRPRPVLRPCGHRPARGTARPARPRGGAGRPSRWRCSASRGRSQRASTSSASCLPAISRGSTTRRRSASSCR